MSRRQHRPRIGQWYARRDTREVFQVTGLDEHARTVEVQTSDGNLDEIELRQWRVMSVTPVEPPEEGCEAIDLQTDDFEGPSCQHAGFRGAATDPFGAQEAWEDTVTEEEIDFLTERTNPEHLP
jgi:Family of unknown function (DUF6763)